MTDLDGVKLARKQFPVLDGGGAKIDWQLVADHGSQAEKNHSQTVERLAQRGGLSWCELYAVLHNKRWEKMDQNEALIACRALEARYLSALSPTPEAPAPALGSGETEWIGDFLNRRTDVEKVLRDVKRGKRQALSPEECWELANRLSVPANHGGA